MKSDKPDHAVEDRLAFAGAVVLREQFEAWTKRQPGDEMDLSGAQWGVSFMYADPLTQAAWIGWQGHATS